MGIYRKVLGVLLALANCWILLRNPLNNDVAWYLYLGREMLAGRRLYIDYVETNPPLICFLSTIPVWIAQVLHLDPKLVWVVLITALLVGLASASARFWSSAMGGRPRSRTAIFLLQLVVTLAFFFAFAFGQRDHLGLAASLPVCGILATRVAQTERISGVIAVAAGCGLLLALKPFFLLPWLLCLMWAVYVCGWRQVARWPETYVVPAMSLVQPLLILFVTPAYLEVARMVASLYSSFNPASAWELLTDKFLLVSLVIGLAALFYPAPPERRNSIRMASLATLGWYLSAVLQRKGWHYHVLPSVAAASFTAWLILLDVGSRQTERTFPWKTAVPAAAVLLLLLVAGMRTARLRWDYPAGNSNLIPIVGREAHGGTIVALATGMSSFPLVNDTGTHLGIRYNALWWLPGLYAGQVAGGTPDGTWHYRRPDQMGAPEKEMFASIASGLAAEPPLVLVPKGVQQGMGSLKIDLIGYFAQDPRAGAALRHYAPMPVQGDFLVLRRVPERVSLR